MSERIKPYVVGTEFDKSVDNSDPDYWWTAGDIRIGNRLDDTILNDEFTMYVCSKRFKQSPTDDFKGDTQSMFVQETYDPTEAEAYIKTIIDSMGEMSVSDFFKKARDYLYDEYYEWNATKPRG